MADENEFYRLLADVPGIPPDIYNRIDRTIRRTTANVRLLSIAAAVVVAAGAGVLLFNNVFVNDPLRPEVASELQTVREFLNGSDLESEIELYAVVEGY